jgi:methylated-DNA-[protein]-cysteine S-methyltransferase
VRAERVTYAAPGWGVGELWLAEGRVLEIAHPVPDREEARGTHPLADRLAAWFAGGRDDFLDVPLELDWCTAAQRALVDAARAVPYGETMTYSELAAAAGLPRAARASGTFCARNRFAVVVPCHRIVSASGLGGYGSLGASYKRALLALEATSRRAGPGLKPRRGRADTPAA